MTPLTYLPGMPTRPFRHRAAPDGGKDSSQKPRRSLRQTLFHSSVIRNILWWKRFSLRRDRQHCWRWAWSKIKNKNQKPRSLYLFCTNYPLGKCVMPSFGIFDHNPWCAMKRARYSSGGRYPPGSCCSNRKQPERSLLVTAVVEASGTKRSRNGDQARTQAEAPMDAPK